MRLLVVTAVATEREAVRAGLAGPAGPAGPAGTTVHIGLAGRRGAGVEVRAVGVGPAAAAAGTALAVTELAPDTVICAGIAGGFAAHAGIGATVLGSASVAADLGVEDPAAPGGFRTVDELGFGISRLAADPALLGMLRDALPAAVPAEILTVSTVTGTAASTAVLTARYPGAAAEAMEGFGAATAAALAGVPFIEVRTVSNLVGPRDRDGWRIGAAMRALTEVGTALGTLGTFTG